VTKSFTIERALADPNLLGAALGPVETWATWLAVLKASFGLKLNRSERKAFESVAGSREPPQQQVAELWAIVGRRGGKSRMAAALAVFLASFVDHSKKLAAGEVGYVLVLAPTQKQAHLVFGYAKAFIESSPILLRQIDRTLADEIRLTNGVTIAVHPASFRSVRGRTLVGCIFDESAFWRDETSAEPDIEVYRAVLPALMSAHGTLVGISSPYRRLGLLYAKHRDFYGVDDPNVLVVQGSSQIFNPTLDAHIIASARASDPEAALAEYDAQFRNDLSNLFDDAVIDAAIDHARPPELPRLPGIKYFAFVDASAGRHDHFTAAISHQERDGDGIVIDALNGFGPPFDPNVVASDFARLAKRYGCSKIVGDAFAGEWVSQAFNRAGVKYERAEANRSAIYLERLPLFARHAVRLPDHARLIRELRLLERSVHRSGKDSVDHPRGGSDDYANAACGSLWLDSQVVKLGEVRTGFYMPGGGKIIWQHQRPRRELKIVNYTEKEYLALKEAGRW
jgi:hypothetical protein